MGKLKPFDFNAPPVGPIEVALRRRKGIETRSFATKNAVPDLLCSICSAPLDARDFSNDSRESTDDDSFASSMSVDAFRRTCCRSCSFQIIPKEPKAFFEILPEAMKERSYTNVRDKQSWMRYCYIPTFHAFLRFDILT